METPCHWGRPRIFLGRCPLVENGVQLFQPESHLFFPRHFGALAESEGSLGECPDLGWGLGPLYCGEVGPSFSSSKMGYGATQGALSGGQRAVPRSAHPHLPQF